jgi:hypothetical protein
MSLVVQVIVRNGLAIVPLIVLVGESNRNLLRLFLVLERGFPSEKATEAMRKVLGHRKQFVWLDPPSPIDLIRIKVFVRFSFAVGALQPGKRSTVRE